MLTILTRTSSLRHAAVVAGALACALLGVCGPAAAQAEEEETFEQGIIRSLLGGSKPGINYRERSPLVLPPSRELPAPESATSVDRATAWPQDPDARRARAASGRMGADENAEAGARRSSPDELRHGTARGAAGPQAPHLTLSDNEASRPLRPSEIGGKSLSVFDIFANRQEGAAAFTGEPSRSRLTEPPPGYRSPSASQPYAPPKDTSWFKIPNPFDRGLGDVK